MYIPYYQEQNYLREQLIVSGKYVYRNTCINTYKRVAISAPGQDKPIAITLCTPEVHIRGTHGERAKTGYGDKECKENINTMHVSPGNPAIAEE